MCVTDEAVGIASGMLFRCAVGTILIWEVLRVVRWWFERWLERR